MSGVGVFGRTSNGRSRVLFVLLAQWIVLVCDNVGDVSAFVAGFVLAPSPFSSSLRSPTSIVVRRASSASDDVAASSSSSARRDENDDEKENGNDVLVLDRGENDSHVVVVYKPPSVICHHNEWSGRKGSASAETPMLQRVRDGLNEGRRVNLVHRLDRGASGCLLVALDGEDGDDDEDGGEDDGDDATLSSRTRALQAALSAEDAEKTYVALVRGSGVTKGEDLRGRGWFEIDRPLSDAAAVTRVRFVAGDEDARVSLVLARPTTGRWHQVRRHLAGISHPILGDTSHGCGRTNKEWRTARGMPGARTFLHLARLRATSVGVDARCPLPPDATRLLRDHAPSLLTDADAAAVLAEEGVTVLRNEEEERAFFLRGRGRRRSVENAEARPTRSDDDDDRAVTLLARGPGFVVAEKPPGVVCHASAWTDHDADEPTPMLQRVRDALRRAERRPGEREPRRFVNLVHRLDRGASGCLLLTTDDDDEHDDEDNLRRVTRTFVEAMQEADAEKLYVALVHVRPDDDGLHDGEPLDVRGWFPFTSRLRNSRGQRHSREATTYFRFLPAPSSSSSVNNNDCRLVLCRPHRSGQFHQIRQQLRQLRRPIVGDTSHGFTKKDREWRESESSGGDSSSRLPPRRTCLHLARVRIPSVGVDASCPLPEDMRGLLRTRYCGSTTAAWDETVRRLRVEEGIELQS